MPMTRKIAAMLAVGATVAVALPLLAQQRAASGPVARYDMRAGTISGMGSGQMNPMAMMMGGGRGNNVQHELYLRLGSSSTPTGGSPKAEHFMPPNARLGKSVVLTTPGQERLPDELPQKPRGRLLLYWGCGEHAPAGQPVVIDFARLAAGQMPPGLRSNTVIRDWGPTLTNSRTFGRWPSEDGKFVKPDTSLSGPHRVAGNYSPEMNFTLTKDFMGALSSRATANPSGSTLVQWSGLADATGYLVTMFGGKQGPGGQMGDMVMWTSSSTRQFGGGFSDWLTPGQVAGLVRDRTLLPPTATSCTIPLEVRRDAADFRMGSLNAFGPMEEFSYPPRPASGPWNLQWTARIRHKSTYNWMDIPGMGAMGGMEGMNEDEGDGRRQPRQQSECRPRRGLGGLLGGALGGGSGC